MPDFRGALADEVSAAQQQGGERIRLSQGRLVGPTTSGWLYEFRLASETAVPDGCGVEVRVGTAVFQGSVTALEGFDILIELDEPLDPIPQHAMLVIKLWYILESLSERLAFLAAHDTSDGASDLLGAVSPGQSTSRILMDTPDVAGLNEQQSRAVHQALEMPATFIWGPPGTGKTTTVGALVKEADKRGLRTLVLAYSNAALDTAMLAAGRRYDGTPAQLAGRAIRVGTPRLPEMREHLWLPTEAVARVRHPDVIAERDQLRARLHELKGQRRAPEMAEIRQRLNTIRQDLRTFEKDLIRAAQVVGCTLAYAAVQDQMLEEAFDLVVLDEASMASVPFGALAAALATSHLVVAGDFRQLPPVVLAKTQQAAEWLERGLFEFASVPEQVRAGHEDPRLVMLRRQYRMHPAISSVVSTVFYGGLLSDGEGTEQRTQAISARTPVAGTPIVIVDTSKLGSRCVQEPAHHGKSRFNLVHALVDLWWIGLGVERHESIAVIAPYRAQARLLRMMVDDVGWGETVQVATVHRFQGGEADMVVLDLTTAEPHRALGPLLGGGLWDLAGRLLNVAISRPRGKLVVVADLARIKRLATNEDRAILDVLGALAGAARGGSISLDDLGRGLESVPTGGTVSIEHGQLYSGSVVQAAKDANEIFLNVNTGTSAPVWVTDAGTRGAHVFVNGTDLHKTWLAIASSRVRNLRRYENTALINRSELWHEVEIGKRTAHLKLPQTSAYLGELLHVIPDEEQRAESSRREERTLVAVSCTSCGGTMWLDEGNFGPFLRCLDCRQTRSLNVQVGTELVHLMQLVCAYCGALPVVRSGTHGPIARCSRNGCDWKQSLSELV
ncbi:MAG: AAA domain-containing protein [Tepidiformaceae bacterium]